MSGGMKLATPEQRHNTFYAAVLEAAAAVPDVEAVAILAQILGRYIMAAQIYGTPGDKQVLLATALKNLEHTVGEFPDIAAAFAMPLSAKPKN